MSVWIPKPPRRNTHLFRLIQQFGTEQRVRTYVIKLLTHGVDLEEAALRLGMNVPSLRTLLQRWQLDMQPARIVVELRTGRKHYPEPDAEDSE